MSQFFTSNGTNYLLEVEIPPDAQLPSLDGVPLEVYGRNIQGIIIQGEAELQGDGRVLVHFEPEALTPGTWRMEHLGVPVGEDPITLVPVLEIEVVKSYKSS